MVSVSTLVAEPTGMGNDNEGFQEVSSRKKGHANYVKKTRSTESTETKGKQQKQKRSGNQKRAKSKNRKKKSSTGNKHKKPDPKSRSKSQKQKSPPKNSDLEYDITKDKSIIVAEARDFPEARLLDDRKTMHLLLREALDHGVEDECVFFDALYQQQFEGLDGIYYVGIVGSFLDAFRLGLDLLTLVPITHERNVEECAALITLRGFRDALKNLREGIVNAQNNHCWDVLLFRVEALLEAVEGIYAGDGGLNFNEVLGFLYMLNVHFIESLESLFQENPVLHDGLGLLPEGLLDVGNDGLTQVDPLREDQEGSTVDEAFYFLPDGLLDLEVDGLERARLLLEEALQPRPFIDVGSGWGLFLG